jgi:hypothetical protein
MLVEQWTPVGTLDFFDDLGDTIRTEERGTFRTLDIAHLLGHMRALVEQGEQLLVQRVDLHTQTCKGIGL